MADLVLSLLDPIKDVCYRIKRHISYSCTYKTEVEELLREAEKLTDQKERLQLSVNDAVRNGEEIYGNVVEWLTSYNETIEEVHHLLQEEAAKNRCFFGLYPNLKVRYQLGKAAVKKASAIDQLRNEGKFDLVSYRPPPRQLVTQSVYHREALESRMSILNQVMDALKDPEINIIGVHGMGGVGKTTLAKEVHRQAEAEMLFDVVVMVCVSQTPDIRRIQREIAEVLGLNLVEEGLLLGAHRLCERMKNEEILIILDDIWGQLHLDEIGIPCGDDYKRCKLLLTTRITSVLSDMGTQKIFTVPPLTQVEAFKLFAMTVDHAKDPKFSAIANQIVQKCGGLPFLTLVVAKDLRNCQELNTWNDKLRHLSAFDSEETSQKANIFIESSYNMLPCNDIKYFFLLCALFGQSNVQIEYLLRYGVGLNFFKQTRTIQQARERVYAIIQQLEDYSLLLPSDQNEFVNVSDFVRDVALSIASRVQHAFVCPSGVRMTTFPNKDCSVISLQYCDFQEHAGPDSELSGFDCPKAELLLLLTENLSLRIPDSFFEGVRKLKVLNFTGMRFGSLPRSLNLLTEVGTLCLNGCQLEKVPIIGELKQLQVLSFADSYIVELPREIEQLTLLKVLDLSNCSKLQVIPAKVLSKLSMLEELYMGNSFTQWEAKGIKDQCNASLEELGGLKCLTTLELQVLDAEVVYEWDWSTGLQRYKIFIGDEWDWNGIYETSTTLKLKMMASSENIFDGVKALLRKTGELYLDDGSGIMSEFFDLDGGGFPQLKHLHLQNNHVIQHSISSMQSTSCQAFPILETLVVDRLMNLEKICHGQLEAGSFSKLRILKVRNCNKLTSLFSISMARCLFQLQEIEVISCDNIEIIVVGETDEDETLELKQLRSLTLEKLPRLRSFCSKNKQSVDFQAGQPSEIIPEEKVDTPSSLFTRMVSLPSLTSIVVNECNGFSYLFTTSFVESLVQLKKLKLYYCESVEEIIVAEQCAEEKNVDMIIFPKLDSLFLELLPNLFRFCAVYSVDFQSLNELHIASCYSLLTFITKVKKVNSDTHSKSLFNEMGIFSKLESLSLSSMRNFRSVWHNQLATDSFSKLKSLNISFCHGIVTLFSSNVSPRLYRLENLKILSCHSVQSIYQIPMTSAEQSENVEQAFELKELYLSSLSSLKHIWDEDPQGVFTFQNLQSVHVSDCNILKNVFPASIARNLLLLEKLQLWKCRVKEIVAKADGEGLVIGPCFKFPQLTSLQLLHLKEVRTFYPDRHTCEWPKLKHLGVIDCCKLKIFTPEVSSVEEEISRENITEEPLLAERVSSKLEELALESKDFIEIMQLRHQFPNEHFSRLKVLNLLDLPERWLLFPYGLLERFPCLEKLKINGGSMEEVFSHEGPVKDLERLKNLTLSSLHKLRYIWKEDSELASFSQYLETLEIMHCNSLIYVPPPSSSFRNLITLEVSFCARLTTLVTASTAKTMVQLTKMKIYGCDMMTEIVSGDGEQMEDFEIIFNKLKTLELKCLYRLVSFFSGKQTFHFPSLEEVTVDKCFQLKTFSQGVLTTPKLRGVQLNSENDLQWAGNLNATVACQLTDRVGTNFICNELNGEWHGELQGSIFHNVALLKGDKHVLPLTAISSNLLQHLNKSKMLEVMGCDSVEVVFDLESLSADAVPLGLLSQLRWLYLSNLPMLRHIWNKNPGGILDFGNLKWLNVSNCCNLKYAFTWSMCMCLVQLGEIEIKNCDMMEAIIVDEEAAAHNVIFPSLKSVVLDCLPQLSSFYSGSDLKCPSLDKISIYDCPKLILFCFGVLSTPKLDHSSVTYYGGDSSCNLHLNSAIQLYTEMVGTYFILSQFPELKENWRHGTLPCLLFHNIEELLVDDYTLSPIAISSKLLPYLNKLGTLEVRDCDSAQVIFDLEGLSPNEEHLRLLPKLSRLYLSNLPMLSRIWNKNPGEILNFTNLKFLEVQNCSNLKHAFTWSMSMCFEHLEEMVIKNCDMIEAVIADEDAGATLAKNIIFPSLKSLVLECLPKLSGLYSGKRSLECPLLKKISIYDCPNVTARHDTMP